MSQKHERPTLRDATKRILAVYVKDACEGIWATGERRANGYRSWQALRALGLKEECPYQEESDGIKR